MGLFSGRDKSEMRGGFFLAAGMWLFGIVLIIAFMAYTAIGE